MTVLVGEVEVVPIVELEAGPLIQRLITEATPARVREIEWLVPSFADRDGNLRATVQGFLVRSNGTNVLVDTGIGDDKPRAEIPEWSQLRTGFLERLRATGVEPSDISTVVCTHIHIDHVGWNTSLRDGRWVPTFPSATYVFVREEYEWWTADAQRGSPDSRAAFEDSVRPIVEAGLAELVDGKHRLDSSLRLVPTPGHTANHVSVAIESAGERGLITGDVLHHPCQLAFPHWSTSADEDPDGAATTRARVLGEAADAGTLLIGSHFTETPAGLLIREDGGFRLDV
ncbi:MAG TPA: MBL fold metallo-hydrolase [Gaiellaceae bacterium]